MAIQNRYEFMYYVACTNCNPNGDPDMGNMPRLDPQTMQGFITDAATKRRIRNYVELAHQGEPGMNIIIQQATNINRHIARPSGQPVLKTAQRQRKPFTRAEKRPVSCSTMYVPSAQSCPLAPTRGRCAGRCRSPTEKVWTPFFRWTFPSPVWRLPTR